MRPVDKHVHSTSSLFTTMISALLLLVLFYSAVHGIVLPEDIGEKTPTGNAVNSCTTPGCYNGYCWAYCGSVKNPKDWCYTTRGERYDSSYVKCTKDSECDGCWNCAGSCYRPAESYRRKKKNYSGEVFRWLEKVADRLHGRTRQSY